MYVVIGLPTADPFTALDHRLLDGDPTRSHVIEELP